MSLYHLECKPDETLLKTLINPGRKKIIHHNDKGRVCFHLSKNNNLIGLVDEDPNSSQPKYFEKLKIISNKYGVKELGDNSSNRLIVLCPRLEGWLTKCCEESKIDMLKDFSLPNTENQLHSEINWKLNKIERLIIYLIEVKNKPILHLKSLLSTN